MIAYNPNILESFVMIYKLTECLQTFKSWTCTASWPLYCYLKTKEAQNYQEQHVYNMFPKKTKNKQYSLQLY